MAADGTVGIVLAAGAGTRLAPLTELRPKPLCPVDNRTLLDWALDRIAPHVTDTAVNVHHHRRRMLEHLADTRVEVSVEDEPLGTAGGVAKLASWIAGRSALVVNADAWGTDPLDRLVEDWGGDTIRLLVSYAPSRPDFDGMWGFAGASLMPWDDVTGLAVEPSGLYEVLWREAHAAGRLELVPTSGIAIDCGTPENYLAANLIASAGRSVVGDGAVVEGSLTGSVVWPGARVSRGEHLRYAIRLPDGRTVPGRAGR